MSEGEHERGGIHVVQWRMAGTETYLGGRVDGEKGNGHGAAAGADVDNGAARAAAEGRGARL